MNAGDTVDRAGLDRALEQKLKTHVCDGAGDHAHFLMLSCLACRDAGIDGAGLGVAYTPGTLTIGCLSCRHEVLRVKL